MEKQVLVVDDDQEILNLMVTFLKELNCRIKFVSGGEQALEELARERYDLVITDILMPELNGIDLTQLIAEKYPDIYILVVSEGGTTDAREIVAAILLNKAISFGAIRGMMKPFSKNELVDMVNDILSGKLD